MAQRPELPFVPGRRSTACCCCLNEFFLVQERDEIGVLAVKFEKIALVNVALATLIFVMMIILTSTTGERPNFSSFALAVAIIGVQFMAFYGAAKRNQTLITMWLCLQGCSLCCGVVTIFVLISSIAAVMSKFSDNSDLTPAYDGVAAGQQAVDDTMGVVDMIINFLAFISQIIGAAYGFQLNSMFSGPPARAVVQTGHVPQRRAERPQYTDERGRVLEYAEPAPPGSMPHTLALTSHAPITLYDVEGHPCAIAIEVSSSDIDDLLSERPTLIQKPKKKSKKRSKK